MTNVSSVSGPLFHSSKITAMAMGWPSPVPAVRQLLALVERAHHQDAARGGKRVANVRRWSIVSARTCMCFGREGLGSVPGEAPPHRHHLALVCCVQPHDIGCSHRRGDHDRIAILFDDQRLGESMHLLPGLVLGELAAHLPSIHQPTIAVGPALRGAVSAGVC